MGTMLSWAGLAPGLAAFFGDAEAHVVEDLGSAGGVGGEGDGVFAGDVEACGGGEGVLVGGKEDEFPALGAFFADEVSDVRLGVLRAGVFFAVGEDGDDDFLRPLRCRAGGKGSGHFLEGATDGIKEGGAATGLVSGGGEVGDFGEGDGFDGDIVLVIEEDEGEAGFAFFAALGGEEGIEATDGVVHDGLHGPGAVEDDGDFGHKLAVAYRLTDQREQRWGQRAGSGLKVLKRIWATETNLNRGGGTEWKRMPNDIQAFD